MGYRYATASVVILSSFREDVQVTEPMFSPPRAVKRAKEAWPPHQTKLQALGVQTLTTAQQMTRFAPMPVIAWPLSFGRKFWLSSVFCFPLRIV